jgi:Flp pilus assembly pilin Flp
MFSRVAIFLKRDDGLSAVEYGVMLGLLVVACVIVLALGGIGTDGQGNARAFTVTFNRGTTKSARTWDPGHRQDGSAFPPPPTVASPAGASGGDTSVADRGSGSTAMGNGGNASAALGSSEMPPTADAKDKVGEGKKTMSAGDARQALLGLLRAYPRAFSTSEATVLMARLVQKADHVEIGSFRCYLRTQTFTYQAPQGSGRLRDTKSGVFYQEVDGTWTGRLTNTAGN